MLAGRREGNPRPPATVRLTGVNFGAYPMPNGLSRLASRFPTAVLPVPMNPVRVMFIEGQTQD